MEQLPVHSTFLQDVHDFLKRLATENLPELLPEQVMYGIYLRQKGLSPTIASDTHHSLWFEEQIFGQCVKFILEYGDPLLLPYGYTPRHPSAAKNGRSKLSGLCALCQKYQISGWDDNGAPNWCYSGLIYQKKKGGISYAEYVSQRT